MLEILLIAVYVFPLIIAANLVATDARRLSPLLGDSDLWVRECQRAMAIVRSCSETQLSFAEAPLLSTPKSQCIGPPRFL